MIRIFRNHREDQPMAGWPGVGRFRICPHFVICGRGLREGGVAAVPDGPTLCAPMPLTPAAALYSAPHGSGK
jgi:hypothetical protein